MSNSPKTIRPFAANAVVRWEPSMRPVNAPDVTGVVFMSRGRETFVVWAGTTRPQMVFTGAMVKA